MIHGCSWFGWNLPYLFCAITKVLSPFVLFDHSFRSHVATEENVQEAIRLFTVSTMDAARSGINQQVNLTPEMANEIKVCQ